MEVLFLARGNTSELLDLSSQLEGELLSRIVIDESSNIDQVPVDENSIIIKLPLPDGDDSEAIKMVEQWLERNFSVLGAVDARKIIEFQTYLEPNCGSRIFLIPNAIIRICGQLGLDIAHQVIRVL